MERKDSQEKRKRVSFATEARVKYIYNEEGQNTKSSSSLANMSIDNENQLSLEMTCDGNLLEQEETQNEVKESKDVLKLFNKEEVENINLQLDSIDIDSNLFNMNIDNIIGKEGVVFSNQFKNDISKENENMNCSFLSSNTAIETINVEEIINTQDLRKIIPETRKDEKSLTEILSKYGIRFLDKLVVTNTRRDTISKSRNNVEPSMIEYYRNFLNQKIEYYSDFSNFLEGKMAEEEKANEAIEKDFTLAGTILEKKEDIGQHLKSLKAECRTRAKIKWYELRKSREIGFNLKLTELKNKMNEEFIMLNSKNVEMENKITSKREKNESLRKKISILKSRMNNFNEKEILEVEKMQDGIKNQNMVMESCKAELEDLIELENMKRKEEETLGFQMANFKNEIMDLEVKIKKKDINEEQVSKVKKEYERMCSIFKVKILKLTKDLLKISFFDYEFEFTFDEGIIRNLEIKVNNSSNRLIHSIIKNYGIDYLKKSKLENMDVYKKLREMILKCKIINSFCKEIDIIEEKHVIDCHIESDHLVITTELIHTSKLSKCKINFYVNDFVEFKHTIVESNFASDWNVNKYGYITETINDIYKRL